MKIYFKDGKLVDLPDHGPKEVGAFKGDTPYLNKLLTRLKNSSYRNNKLSAKLLCLEQLADIISNRGGFASYFEPLAGVGLSAALFGDGEELHLNDMDIACQQVLRANFPRATVSGEDMFKMRFPEVDLTFLDFNDFTLKRFGEYGIHIARALHSTNRFVILNDCSMFYLRYGASSYQNYSKRLGKTVTTPDEFIREAAKHYVNSHWKLLAARYFRETAFLLFAFTSTEVNPDIAEVVPSPVVRINEGFLC